MGCEKKSFAGCETGLHCLLNGSFPRSVKVGFRCYSLIIEYVLPMGLGKFVLRFDLKEMDVNLSIIGTVVLFCI